MQQAMPNWFRFLRIEADLAVLYIDIASRSNPLKSARFLMHARKACAEIKRALADPAHHGLNEDQVVSLELCRTEIELALENTRPKSN
jgi:hypothetical protein